jgi:hypothetical protein
MMSAQFPLLAALACPVGMAVMMAGPALVRRFSRRAKPADPPAGSRSGAAVSQEESR